MRYNFLLYVYEKIRQWEEALRTSSFKCKMMDLCHKMQNKGDCELLKHMV
jgi:hypothetical protein